MRRVKLLTFLLALLISYQVAMPMTIEEDFYAKNEPRIINLYQKITKNKNKFGLQYKSDEELLGYCKTICEMTCKSKDFDEYDIAAIIIQESRFNENAVNKSDGGKGLAQITNPHWYKKFKITDPFNGNSAIENCVLILHDIKTEYRFNKMMTIRSYNGKGKMADKYVKSVTNIKKELKT